MNAKKVANSSGIWTAVVSLWGNSSPKGEPRAAEPERLRDKLLFNGLLPVKQQWTVDSGKWTVVVSPSGMK